MNYLIAIDKFKQTISQKDLSDMLNDHLTQLGHETITLPISDGGHGFLDVIIDVYDVKPIMINTVNAFLEDIQVPICIINEKAYIESSYVCGMQNINNQSLNPMHTSTYGLGLLIKKILKMQIFDIVLGIGGSITNDGGAGLLQALGISFATTDDVLKFPISGTHLKDIYKIDDEEFKNLVKDLHITLVHDVKNPLLGPHGATHIYAKQKGADDAMVIQLESHMTYYKNIISHHTKTDLSHKEGAGAAGGIGFAVMTFFNCQSVLGIDFVMDLLKIEKTIKTCDVLIVGEGKFDAQSLFGKAPLMLAQKAKAYDKKVIGLFGQCDIHHATFDEVHALVPNYVSLSEAFNQPHQSFKKMLNQIFK